MHAEKALPREIENVILNILEKRQRGKSCCPSEAARKVDPLKWRDLMPLIREIARKLRSEGRLEICQRGTVLTSDSWTGPIRLRLPVDHLTSSSMTSAGVPSVNELHQASTQTHLPVQLTDASHGNSHSLKAPSKDKSVVNRKRQREKSPSA